jgi:hypothetical protein
MFLSPHQNAGQNWNIKIANRWIENVSQFKYLGETLTTKICFRRKLRGD